MAFLAPLRFRSKAKEKSNFPEAAVYNYQNATLDHPPRGLVQKLSANVLVQIFLLVCPHSQDETYITCDESFGSGCMLCQTRDLSKCAQVCKGWKRTADRLLYHSVRLDSVHFCGLESQRAVRKKSKGKSNQESREAGTAGWRLQLFARAMRENTDLAEMVQILKVAFMTRESCKADLARTVAALPNLRYIDLPEGVFNGDPSCLVLRRELESRTIQLRKMKFMSGSERAFALLVERSFWPHLEVMEIDSLSIAGNTLLHGFSSFTTLRELKLSGPMLALNDSLFNSTVGSASFPSIEKLILESSPSVTSVGLCVFLSRHDTRNRLVSLTLNETGVLPQELHNILREATSLAELSFSQIFPTPFTLSDVTPLASSTLKTLYIGILPPTAKDSYISESYYAYVATSLLSNGLPALVSLFAYSNDLPSIISRALLGPAQSPIQWDLSLDLFTKPPAQPELEWSLTTFRETNSNPTPLVVEPALPVSMGTTVSATRPLSFYVARGLPADTDSAASGCQSSKAEPTSFGGIMPSRLPSNVNRGGFLSTPVPFTVVKSDRNRRGQSAESIGDWMG